MDGLSERNARVLLCFANGMVTKVVARTLLMSQWQVQYDCLQIREQLQARTMAEAVAKAWRQGLIHADEIAGGPNSVAEEFQIEVLLDYRARHRRSPPRESWPELRERARVIAADYRASKARAA